MHDSTITSLPGDQHDADSDLARIAEAGRAESTAPTRVLRRLHGIDHESDLAASLAAWRPLVGLGGEGARFILGGRLGQGSQGVVFALRDRDAQRTVALKTLNGREIDPENASRFLHEVQITAQLEHPGVVPVHDVDVLPDGTVFYTMKRVEGMVLSDWLAGRSGSAKHRFEVIQLFLKVCDTMAFAHSRGVVHRDIKPRNVMVGTYGEVLVMDWGLAKVQGDDEPVARTGSEVRLTRKADHETQDGTAVGTPAYMSPEQARGQLEQVDNRSDIYGLGVLLYEMLAGASPYIRGDLRRTIAQVVAGQWMPIDRQPACRTLPRRLAAIVHKAMALRQEDRYQHVGMLADDLRAFLAGSSVSAYRESLADTIARLFDSHRRRVIWGLAGVLAVALSAGAVQWRQHRTNAAQIETLGRTEAQAVAQQHWAEARKAADAILVLHPDDRAAAQRSREHYVKEQTAAREAAQAELIRNDHARAAQLRAQAGLAAVTADETGLSEAIAKMREALALHPNAPDLIADLEGYVAKRSDLRAAAEQAAGERQRREAAEAKTRQLRENAAVLAGQAADAEARGDFDGALGALSSAIELVPEPAWIERKVVIEERCRAMKVEQDRLLREQEQQAERERRRVQAEQLLRQADAAVEVARTLRDVRAQRGDEVRRLRDELGESGEAARRSALAEAEAACRDAERARAARLAEAVTLLNSAQALAADHLPVRAALADFWIERLRESEESGDIAGAEAAVAQARGFDDGRYADVLAGNAVVANRGGVVVRLTRIERTPERTEAPADGTVEVPAGGQATVAHGRYLVVTADDVRLAVVLERGRTLALDLPRPPAAMPSGGVFIPGGTLRDAAGHVGAQVAPFVMMAREVTCGAWLAFINDPHIAERIDDGPRLLLAPRDSAFASQPLWQRRGRFLNRGGAFVLETADGSVDVGRPVSGISHDDAVAYAAWLARRDGHLWRLPTVEEWQFAVQGGDGRAYPWGSADDLSLCASAVVLARDAAIATAAGASCPADCSVQGVYDLAGSRSEYCAGTSAFGGDLRPLMGGSIFERLSERFSAWGRRDIDRRLVHPGWGVRLVYTP